jgi:hypothetical protein
LIAALARPPWVRLLRAPRARIAAGGWLAVAVAFAIVTRTRGFSHPADRVLLEAYGPLVLPLLAYALVGVVVSGGPLSAAVAPLTALGAPPARVAAAACAVACAACLAGGGLLAAVVDALAHGTADAQPARELARDVWASAYAGGLGGAAYGAWFALGASFGRRGGGRLVFLAGDWILGSNDGATAVFTPRGHVRGLLGGAPPMDLSSRASTGALVAIAVVCALAATRRARR